MQPVTEYKEFSTWLWEKRRTTRPEISLNDAARTAGVCRQTYRKWEQGKSSPDFVQLMQLAQVYDWQLPPNVDRLIS